MNSRYSSPGKTECLEAVLLTSPHAAASIVRKSAESAKSEEGVSAIYFAEDLCQQQELSLLAREDVEYPGQVVGIVIGRDRGSCLQARDRIEVEYHATPGVLDVDHAKAVRNELSEKRILVRGNPEKEMGNCDVQLKGSVSIAGQYPLGCGEMFVVADPWEDGRGIQVRVPAENPDAVRIAIAKVTGIPQGRILVHGLPIQGYTGGRGEVSIQAACLASLAALELKRMVRLELEEEQELLLSGKRHAVEVEFSAGCDKSGLISALDIDLVMDGGVDGDHSKPSLELALLHLDGGYGIEHFRAAGCLCRTNSFTGMSIPAEGMAQGVMVMEEIIGRVARKVGKPAEAVRELNFYRKKKKKASTPYGQTVDEELISRLWIASLSSSDLHRRKDEILAWNRKNRACKRGIAAVPVKVGVGDPAHGDGEASARVQTFSDGSVRVRYSVVDTGEGLSAKVIRLVGQLLGVEEENIEVMKGADDSWFPFTNMYHLDKESLLMGAVKDACDQVKGILDENCRDESGEKGSGLFSSRPADSDGPVLSLTAMGYSKNLKRDWDGHAFQGNAFDAFYYGVAVVEVELDTFSGEVQVLRTDLCSAGEKGEHADLDSAQLSRAYMMGQSWVINEDVSEHPYIIAGLEEAPFDLRISWFEENEHKEKGRHRVFHAEAGVAMAAAVREALNEAVFASDAEFQSDLSLPFPADPAAVRTYLKMLNRERVRKNEEEPADSES